MSLIRSHVLPRVVAAWLVVGALACPALAQQTVTVIGHAVHERVSTEGAGGNVLAEWEKSAGAEVEWLTFGVTPIHERLFREASLGSTEVDAAFLLNRFTDETVVNLFEPLDVHLAKAPIEDFEGISPGMRAALTFGGKLYGIPFRHATEGMHYNEELLAERGLSRPPQTFPEMIEYAEKMTYKRADGTQVHGFAMGGTAASNIMGFVWAHGGEFITDDFQVKANEKGMVDAVATLARWYKSGVLPKSYINFQTEDVITYMQQGRLALTIQPFGRFRVYNDPEKSKFPGKIKVTATPGAVAGEAAPARTEFWALVIPKNAENKALPWEMIRYLSTPDATMRMAINGNGPIRSSAYESDAVKQKVPYAAQEAAAIAVARVPLPGFKNSAKVDDIVSEEVQAALLGAKTPQQAMDDLTRRVRPLLPAK